MTSASPHSTSRDTAVGPVAAGPAVLLVAVAWAFIPVYGLPSFDTLKTLVLLVGVVVLTVMAARRADDANAYASFVSAHALLLLAGKLPWVPQRKTPFRLIDRKGVQLESSALPAREWTPSSSS